MCIYILLHTHTHTHTHAPSHTSLNGRFGTSFTQIPVSFKGIPHQLLWNDTPQSVDEEGITFTSRLMRRGIPVSHEITNETSKLNNNWSWLRFVSFQLCVSTGPQSNSQVSTNSQKKHVWLWCLNDGEKPMCHGSGREADHGKAGATWWMTKWIWVKYGWWKNSF